jgi:hypothetical protein
MCEDYMKITISLMILSEDDRLKCQGDIFKNLLKNCEIRYTKKGEHLQFENGKISKLAMKNSSLDIKINSSNYNYNDDIINIINAYIQLKDYFLKIEYHRFFSINIFYDKDYPLSLEFGEDVLELLSKNKFSLPISCYTKN